MIAVPMQVAVSTVEIPFAVNADNVTIPVALGIKYSTSQKPTYEGEYEFTPTQQTQIVPTADKVLEHNITINPIPSNYGLITWDGSVLTVS